MRLRPDLSGGEVISDGFRNAYDFTFAASGDVFTFDSDGERDITLPWNRPTIMDLPREERIRVRALMLGAGLPSCVTWPPEILRHGEEPEPEQDHE